MITENKGWPVLRIVGTVVAIAAIGITYLLIQHHQKLEQVGFESGRIVLTAADRGDQRVIARQGNPEVAYRVTLKDAPVGEKLQLSCDWLDPSRQLVRQNHYETLAITTAKWDTHCRYQLQPNAPTGNWTVQMKLGDRALGEAQFEVK
jgi:hypothetical protein